MSRKIQFKIAKLILILLLLFNISHVFAQPAGYTYCADEGDTVNFDYLVDLAYGADGQYNYLYARTGSITFNNSTFGDPIPGTVKKGYSKAAGPTPTPIPRDELLDFDKILFIKKHPQASGERHMCDQYYGHLAGRGGGLFVLEDCFSGNSRVVNVLENSVCENGPYQGQKLTPGAFLSPDLSYDGKTILFAYTRLGSGDDWSEHKSYHIFKVNVDGTGLTQLTTGKWNDFDPCWMPDGRIVFISERRGGYGRCHGRHVPTYTLHTMNADGSNIKCISWHETNEWHPSIDNNGMIVYTRWDYVDRGSNQAHHAWLTSPDGLDARAIQGNYRGNSSDDRRLTPWMEMWIRAIPNSNKYVSCAGEHHGQSYGSLFIFDPDVEDDDLLGQITKLTPEVPWPESAGGGDQYATPWPLSEDLFIVSYDSSGRNHGIHLMEKNGTKELLYRDGSIGCLSPIPLKARPVPHHSPSMLFSTSDEAIVSLMNVYDSLIPWDENEHVTHLRIVQVYPKTTYHQDRPKMGYPVLDNGRGVLGTVPVHEDGSAQFYLPVNKPVYFQALNSEGVALRTMMSDTYVPKGLGRLTCQGCHENRHHAPMIPEKVPLALRNPPSRIEPEVEGSLPLTFPRLVQPVLDRKCISCHGGSRSPDLRGSGSGWSTAYENLENFAAHSTDEQRHRESRSMDKPDYTAKGSRLYKLLKDGHQNVQLTAEEFRRIVVWLDCNSMFYAACEDTGAQEDGRVVWPSLE